MRETPFDKLSDAQLLAACLYGEARGETAPGKIAVGSVILERVKHGGWYGKTIHEVILKPYQFSCFLPNDPNYGKLVHISDQWDESMALDAALNDCWVIATGLINGRILPTVAATHYKTAAVDPEWVEKMTFVDRIGNHQFYMEA